MSYIKYDSDLSVSVKNDISDLKSDIVNCFSDISSNAINSKIALDDSRVVVVEEVVKKPGLVASWFGASEKVEKVETKNYSANAALYNEAAEQISIAASKYQKEINLEIDKVVLALEAIDKKILEYENSPLVELEKLEVEYNDSAYSFLYGYASIGVVANEEDRNTFVPAEVPVSSDGSKSDDEENSVIVEETNSEESSVEKSDSEENGEQSTHVVEDGKSLNNEDDEKSEVKLYENNEESSNKYEDGEFNEFDSHSGSDDKSQETDDIKTVETGIYTSNNDELKQDDSENSYEFDIHNGNNAELQKQDNFKEEVKDVSTGSDGNNNLSDAYLIAALMAASGSSDTSKDFSVNEIELNRYNKNNGDKSDNIDDFDNSNSLKEFNDKYEKIPNTGLFSGSIFGSIFSSSYIDKEKNKKDKNIVSEIIKSKYPFIYDFINTLLPLFVLLVILSGVFGIISSGVLGVLLTVLCVFGYFYLEKMYDFWVNNNYFGNDGKSEKKDENKGELILKEEKNTVRDIIVFVFTAFIDFSLVLFKVIKTYWFILLLILLLIIIWIIIIDDDKDDIYLNVWFVLFSSVFGLIFSIILAFNKFISWYWVILGFILFLLSLWYVLKISKKYKKGIS